MKRRPGQRFAVISPVLGALCLASQAAAHHSTAAYNYANDKTLTGVVRVFQWANPHSYIQLRVPDGKGGEQEWVVEMGSTAGQMRSGWTKNSVKPGDKVVVVVAPTRDGSPEGALKTLTLPNGKVLTSAANFIEADEKGTPELSNQLPTLQRATPKKP